MGLTVPDLNKRKRGPNRRTKKAPHDGPSLREVANGQETIRKSTKQEAFLLAYSKIGVISAAARNSGCSRRAHQKWMQEDPAYPDKFREAQLEARDMIEEEVLNRAMAGSDVLLIFAAKAAMPEKYRDNVRLEHSGPNGGPIRTNSQELIDVRVYADEELQAIIQEEQRRLEVRRLEGNGSVIEGEILDSVGSSPGTSPEENGEE